MLQVHHLTKSFAGRILLSDASFAMTKGEHVGMVGRNGSGKTTLFRILTGQMGADSGDVVFPKNYRVAYLEQHLNFTAPTVIEECIKGLPADEVHEHYRVEKILMGLGFEKDDMLKHPSLFSGGQQIRFNLCKILVNPPDLLLLDEPTNYLDIVGMRWLVTWLKSFTGEMILITHDRSFMDQVCHGVMGIYRQKIKSYRGNTENYYNKLAEEETIYQKTMVNQQKKIKKTQEFIDRFRAKARKASQAQSRQKMLDKMDVLEALENGSNLDFHFNAKECPAKICMTVKNLRFHYPGKSDLFSNVSFDVRSDDRIAIIGQNGRGKSTLLNILSQDLVASEGELWNHPDNSLGHFGQTNINRLHGEHQILQELAIANPNLSQQELRQIAGTMMFPGDDALKLIRLLSGGERARVLLGKILAGEHNILLLDEPTNHLDQESVEALIQGIHEFPGAVVMVTHNESIIREVATKLVVFHRHRADYFLGSYDEFLQKIGWESESMDEEGQNKSIKTEKINSYQLKKLRQEIISSVNRESSSLKRDMQQAEACVNLAEEKLKEMQSEFIRVTQEQNSIKIVELSKAIAYQERDIDKFFSRYEELAKKYQDKQDELNRKLNELENN